MEQKKKFGRSQLAGLLAALFCIVVFNSILIIKDKKQQGTDLYASVDFTSPFNLLGDGTSVSEYTIPVDHKAETNFPVASSEKSSEKNIPVMNSGDVEEGPVSPVNNMIVQVAQDDVEASLTSEQKEKVKTTVDATKKILANLQWKEVETAIADVLTDNEKLIAKQQYINELNKTVNWQNVEQNMKAQYENLDWQKIDHKMNNALVAIQLDSLQKTYTIVLNQLNKLTTEAKVNPELNVCPLPDQSIEVIERTKEELSSKINTIKALRSPKKVVRL
jgi:hypothetical protein